MFITVDIMITEKDITVLSEDDYRLLELLVIIGELYPESVHITPLDDGSDSLLNIGRQSLDPFC